MKIKIKAFTLIELLVVIGIIGIVSTLVTVYFATARMSARDARRLADIKEMQLALRMFYTDVGYYPTAITAGQPIANGGTNYLLRVPSNPTPRADNNCPNQDYVYYQLDGGQRFSISFCLGDKTDDLDAGMHSATANGILNCPEGYVAVPGSSTYETNDFCVMKYEAKCVEQTAPTIGLTSPDAGNNTYNNNQTACTSSNGLQIASLASGYPIANISEGDAESYCQAIGAHLMTNPEWMTIIRNSELIFNVNDYDSNWDNGEIGEGYMPRGIFAGNQAWEAVSEYAPTCEQPCTVEERRTLILSNQQRIWDLAGNIGEWLASTCLADNGSGGEGYYYNPGSYIEWSDSNLDDFERGAAGPSVNTWNHTNQGFGQYSGCDSDGNYFVRGGDVDGDNIAGVYALRFEAGSNYAPIIGFRCVK